jgi:uncharacterized RDD family membrane protein YckC
LSELALGSALLVGDNVGTRLQVPLGEGETAPQTLDMILRPVAEWDNAQPTPMDAARHVTIGVLMDVRSNAGRIGHFLYDTTNVIARELDHISRPIRRSRPLRPMRRQFHHYQQRGEQQVARWSAMGRQEETRSRAIAETSLGSFVQRSVSDLTESEQVQVLVQQVVESQSTGLIGEFLDEVRERMVSLDILLSRRAQTSTYAPSAVPPFRATYLRGRPHLAAIPALDRTLAGQYAGFASRAVAFLIDITLLLIALSLATSFINALVSLFNLNLIIDRFMASQGLSGTVAAVIVGLSGMLVVAVYGIVGWSLNGVTVGNLVMGVRVIKADGGRVSTGRAATRMFGAYFSGLLFFLGFIWVIFDKRRQGWHDKLAGTVVLYDWPAMPDDQFLRDQLRKRGVFLHQ